MKPDGVRVPEPTRVDKVLPEHLADEALSLVVFGPGKGEAQVVVLPDGRVGVVDGCREPSSPGGDPVREFLAALDQRASLRGESFRLAFVCLTHPHDDHYAGLGRLLQAYRGRVDAVWSVSKVGDRYAEALSSYVGATHAGRKPLPDDAKVRGLERVLHEFIEAYERQGSRLRQVSQSKSLLKETVHTRRLKISACGPADRDVDKAQLALVKGIEDLLVEGEHAVGFDPNATSGALVIRWGDAGMLLGGDLLCARGDIRGWEDVWHEIEPPIQVVKVAHHASAEAHHDGLWQRLGAPLAIVTPFKDARGSMPPRPEQISRLARDAVVAISSVPDWPPGCSDHPQSLYPVPRPPRSRQGGAKARNGVLPMASNPGPVDAHNAVAVSLDPTGKLVRFVLAGGANVYDEPTRSTGL
ncbi:MAG TPA: MBL fold metallo-hydrolase, partial [Myxococcaceae bacterium]|nr:MBL fold metallo-hydrolase [Myxococcaceae bacterium]